MRCGEVRRAVGRDHDLWRALTFLDAPRVRDGVVARRPGGHHEQLARSGVGFEPLVRRGEVGPGRRERRRRVALGGLGSYGGGGFSLLHEDASDSSVGGPSQAGGAAAEAAGALPASLGEGPPSGAAAGRPLLRAPASPSRHLRAARASSFLSRSSVRARCSLCVWKFMPTTTRSGAAAPLGDAADAAPRLIPLLFRAGRWRALSSRARRRSASRACSGDCAGIGCHMAWISSSVGVALPPVKSKCTSRGRAASLACAAPAPRRTSPAAAPLCLLIAAGPRQRPGIDGGRGSTAAGAAPVAGGTEKEGRGQS